MQMIGQETTKLRDYLPTNPYDWQWRTCSDDHIAPAQKPNRSVTCISHSTRLSVYPVNMPVPALYGQGTGRVGTSPTLPTIGLTGTLRYVACPGCTPANVRGLHCHIPCPAPLLVHVPYRGPYSFAHTDPGRVCPRVSLSSRYPTQYQTRTVLPIPATYRVVRRRAIV